MIFLPLIPLDKLSRLKSVNKNIIPLSLPIPAVLSPINILIKINIILEN